MAERVTGDAIPDYGLLHKIWLYVEHVSGKRDLFTFFVQGLIFLLFKQFPTILGTYLRPLVYRTIMGQTGKSCLIEKNARFEIPLRIFLSDKVFIGENCWISAGGPQGKISFGRNAFIAHHSTLAGQNGSITVGEHVHISRNAYINGIGHVAIGKDTMVGPNVVMISGNHLFDNLDVPIRLQGGDKQKITIEANVWLGANVCVLPGVTIGTGTVVAAGAVVTKDLPPYSIAGGVPVKVIRSRQAEQ